MLKGQWKFLWLLILLMPVAIWWKAQLTFESNTIDSFVHLVESQKPGIDQVIAMSDLLGSFAEQKKRWNEEHAFPANQIARVGTNSTSFALLGQGACGWASELAVGCFDQLGYPTRFVHILDDQGIARHIVMDLQLPNREWVVFDPLLNHLYLDENSGLPIASTELSLHWKSICEDQPKKGVCQYSFEHGVRYTNWAKFGVLKVPVKTVSEWLGIESLRAFWVSKRASLCNALLILELLLVVWLCVEFRERLK